MDQTTTGGLEMLTAVEQRARLGLADVDRYLRSPLNPEDSSLAEKETERAGMAVKILSIYSRIRATRANEVGVAVQIARLMGVEGSALAPLWERLMGSSTLPTARSRGSLESRKGKRDKAK